MTTSADRIHPSDGRQIDHEVESSFPCGGVSPALRHRKGRVALLFRRHIDAISRVTRTLDLRRPIIERSLQCPPPLELALNTLAHLACLQETLTSHNAEVVAVARASGATWTQIGDALGVSKQAAHERFRALSASVPAGPVR